MSMTRFGVQYNGVSMSSIMAPVPFAEHAEASGYDSVFVPDLETLPSLDPLVLLSAMSQRTSRLFLGTSVLILPFRHPYQLAKAAASIDILSSGRLLLGLGAGLLPKDFEVEQVDRTKRGVITDELLAVTARYLRGETVTHHGERYDVSDARLAPPPTGRIPLWLGGTWNGGFASPVLRRAARWADAFHPHDAPVYAYAEAMDRIRTTAADAGRDPSSIGWASNIWLCMGRNKDEALAEVNAAMRQRFGDDAWIVDPANGYALGTTEDCAETIAAYREIGVSHFVVNVLCAPEHILDNLDRFAAEVAPRFREA